MEVSPLYVMTNIFIVSLIYFGLVFAVTWMLIKHTRLFGILFAAALFIFSQLHAMVLYFLQHHTLPIDVTGLILGFAAVIIALFFARGQQKLITKEYWPHFPIALAITAGISITGMVIGLFW